MSLAMRTPEDKAQRAPKCVDLAILGGGCAGLSLARELAKCQTLDSVLVIEPRQTYQDDRSWCFWANDSQALSPWFGHRWPRWSFGKINAQQQHRGCDDFPYRYVRSIDFYRASLAIIERCPSIELKLGQAVTDLSAIEPGWQITTDEETYIARQVVDTRPPAQAQLDQSTLQQCFLGAEIKLNQPVSLDTQTVELMTDMRLVDGEFCFTYVLPLACDHLLVEVTFFAKHPPARTSLHNQLNQLLARRGWSDAQVLRTEFAELPMGLPLVMNAKQKQPVLAGMRGGALRPSSGYGFLRIQDWAQRCAKQYISDGTLARQTTSGYWLQKMDQIFLNVLYHEPARAAEIFDTLLSKTKPVRFIRFMNDQATLSDCLQIVACLPKLPFLRAFLRSLPTLFARPD
jgi:lycopene beta-cyclase